MPIDRKALVSRHNPILTNIHSESPLTVGNGDFAFTADITGFQTLYDEYGVFPLCTMSNWGWHTAPDDAGMTYTSDDLKLTHYKISGREYKYASTPQPGNEHIYHWLRHNPHRLNLARISLLWDERDIKADDLSSIKQKLDLYSGIISSEFYLGGEYIKVTTACARNADVLAFEIDASERAMERLSVLISFPYGSHLKSASDWNSEARHNTDSHFDGDSASINRTVDCTEYFVRLSKIDKFKQIEAHRYVFKGKKFVAMFASAQATLDDITIKSSSEVFSDSIAWWTHFWNSGGAVDFSKAKDPRAFELERRVILSQYLTAVQCSGTIPPQETGLSCNSWYGKFHLEMQIFHAGWFALWGHSELLARSFEWYRSILEIAKKNALQNGFKGARWPKMVDPKGVDSPSWIATLLIWQQPHILYMLELVLQSKPESERANFKEKYNEIVRETALFMRDFMVDGSLPPPQIPAQEEHELEKTLDPVFELSYWKFGLELANSWLGENHNDKLSQLPIIDRLYPAHRNCPNTFEEFNRDHPSMLYAYGFIPNDEVDKAVMNATVDNVLACWEQPTLWGWDFALIAMTLTRLGRPEDAVDILLCDTFKNVYTPNGNNFQKGRDDLPLYLPGNGSLLLALAMMLSGYGEHLGKVGFSQNGLWDDIEVEGIMPLPY